MGFFQQGHFMKKRGILLVARWKAGRQIFTYMFRNHFAEIRYVNDNPNEKAEHLMLIDDSKCLILTSRKR
jgi:hypothetical protein